MNTITVVKKQKKCQVNSAV